MVKSHAACARRLSWILACFTGPVLIISTSFVEDPFYCNFCLVSSKTNRSKHCKLELPPYQPASYAQITSEQSSQLSPINLPKQPINNHEQKYNLVFLDHMQSYLDDVLTYINSLPKTRESLETSIHHADINCMVFSHW